MKKRFLILGIILIVLYLIIGCGSMSQAYPTQISTETKMPEPTATEIPPLTSTPTTIPTLAFFSIDPTIVATANSCDNSLTAPFCVPGITITLSGQKLPKYEVEVSSPGFSGTTSFDCPQQALLVSFGDNMAPVMCDSGEITFVTVGLTEMTLTINWEGGSVTQTLHPDFEILAPQGLECSPQCSIGNSEINIP